MLLSFWLPFTKMSSDANESVVLKLSFHSYSEKRYIITEMAGFGLEEGKPCYLEYVCYVLSFSTLC